MTDQSEVEKVAKELYETGVTFPFLRGYFVSRPDINVYGMCEEIARWHISEKEIAVLEAKIQAIDDLKGKTNYSAKDNDEYVVRWSEFDKEIKKLQSRLAELRKDAS